MPWYIDNCLWIKLTTLDIKGVDFRCILWGISRDEAVNRLNNYVLEDKGGNKWILVQISLLK